MKENIDPLFEMHEKNEKWFNTNFEKLRKKYGSKFFAIKDQDVLAAEEKLEKLLSIIEEKNINISHVFITSTPPEGVASIL